MKKWKTHKFLSLAADLFDAERDFVISVGGRHAAGYWECQHCDFRVELSLNPHLSHMRQTTWGVRRLEGESVKYSFTHENWFEARDRLERVFIKPHIRECGLPPLTEEYASYDGRHGRHLNCLLYTSPSPRD